MDIILERKDFRSDGIYGEITDKNGNFLMFSLEHSYDLKAKVPAGKYTCTRFDSPHLGYLVFMLQDVPDHDHVLIHIGNYNRDSDGCILVGTGIGNKSNGGKMITASERAFKKLMGLQEGVDSFILEVTEYFQGEKQNGKSVT